MATLIYYYDFISQSRLFIMLIKVWNKVETSSECPQQKLKSISCTQEMIRHRPLVPVTPDRNKKQTWVMDPWENTIDESIRSPKEERVLNKHVDNYSTSKYYTRKGDISIDRYDENPMYCTPQSVKNDGEGVEKENKYRFRLYSQARSQKNHKAEDNQEVTTFKKPISSILYPVIKDKLKEKNRRIDRFHSFVARNIRK